MTSRRRNIMLLSFVVPALVLYLVFWVSPVLMSMYYGVTNWTGIGSYRFVGLDNFRMLLKDGTLINSFKNTLIYAAFSVIYGNVLALTLAFILDVKLRLTPVFRTVFYLPTLFSAVVVGFVWAYVYAPYGGMISELFRLAGLESYAPNFLANEHTALIATAFVEKWKSVGTMTIIYLAGIQGIPADVMESAEIDGCSFWNKLIHVKIPLLANTITVNVIMGLIAGMKAFDYVFIMTRGGPGTSTRTLMFSVYQMAFVENQYGAAEALAAVAFVFILLLSVITLGLMKRKEIEA